MTPPDPFDPERLQLNGAAVFGSATTAAKSAKLPRHRPGDWFLRALIPWTWLEAAAGLPGKALALSLCLWREAGRRRCPAVKLCLARVGLGVSKQAARRALRELEAAGLIKVARRPGCGLEVTLLDAPVPDPNGSAEVNSR
jgi:hypothetical protein